MPTLHVIDPVLRDESGHYLGQHMNLWHLARARGFDMVSYCSVDFPEGLLPDGWTAGRVFPAAPSGPGAPAALGHYAADLVATNERCRDGLSRIDPSAIGPGDLLFLTAVTAGTVLGYAEWLKQAGARLNGPVGIYFTLSEELEDTLGRAIRRNGDPLSEESFRHLDDHVVSNDVKKSLYRTLFRQVEAHRARGSYSIFYEDPFPNRNFVDQFLIPGLTYRSLRFMYPRGGAEPAQPPLSGGPARIAFAGSGGVGGTEKGWHLLPDIADRLLEDRDYVELTLHFGRDIDDGERQRAALLAARFGGRLRTVWGSVSCAEYCEIVEWSDLMVLPYGNRYKHIMSGIFDDCVFMGRIPVLPRNSKMARWMDFHNLDVATFEEAEAGQISRAIQAALEDRDRYREGARRAMAIARESWKRNNPLAVMTSTPC